MSPSKVIILGAVATLLGGCATVSTPPERVEAPVSQKQQIMAQNKAQEPSERRYKRKVAIARFSNESNYGRSLMTDQDYDRVGKQASDMLASKLIKSNKFIVFERPDLSKIQREQKNTGDANLIGVDALVVGSVTEFGRSVGGKSGFLSSTKLQTARAKVEARLVDVKTGLAFFSVSGVGEASTESGEVAGFGSRAEYDATLNDRAISAAIADMIDKLVSTLEERKWKTDILEVQGRQVFISGGVKQGMKSGDILQVMEQGATIKSKQSGFNINLPAKKIAEIKIISFFGDNENNEGAVGEMIQGSVSIGDLSRIYVEEVKR